LSSAATATAGAVRKGVCRGQSSNREASGVCEDAKRIQGRAMEKRHSLRKETERRKGKKNAIKLRLPSSNDKCSPQHNPVCARRVDPSALAFSLSCHRHSNISNLFSSSSLHNKEKPITCCTELESLMRRGREGGRAGGRERVKRRMQNENKKIGMRYF
jgi:hypothetical protein